MPKTYLERDTAGTPQQSFVTLPSGAQTVSLLGPFHVAFDDPDIDLNGVVLALIDVDVLVTYAWAEVTDQWNWPGAGSIEIALAPVSDPGNYWSIASYSGGGDHRVNVGGDGIIVTEAPDGGAYGGRPLHFAGHPTVPAQFVCLTFGTATTGEADIYALIATPA